MNKSIYIGLVLIVILLNGCASVKYKNQEPDDVISSAIYEAVGDEIYYLGKENSSYADLCYEYLIRGEGEEQQDVLYDVVIAVNETIKKEGIKDKISIVLSHELPGGRGSCVVLSNYSDDNVKTPDFEELQNLVIVGFSSESECIYNDPSSYISLPDIRKLVVNVEVQQKAENEGIDWYDYWPWLECIEVSASDERCNGKMPDDIVSNAICEAVGYEVFYQGKKDASDGELCYEYYIRDQWKGENDIAVLIGNIVNAVNDTIKEEELRQKICIQLYQRDESSRTELVLSICNYSSDELEYPDFEGLQKAVIMGSKYDDYKYSSPVTYSLLPNIKYLCVSEQMQKIAKELDIDWYDYWQDLESVEVF